ncbi:BTAD domain-containing putative transcriptional regulator [Amycolatopsis suaedae]|uniref:AfsR/SARP family transcriptional regulator n=1 Tax=Amycolatopsis suaedae TaxID=2510978 RepID=A0A4Q7J5T8_9PSEU|nr:BTAD domain-containing putative transcriptional regulator [Amycolatopsis suaedae]RZQ62072.1 AfsR/SARP family transcriptional regulator [Amycolatopsis suaedae]
MRFGVLGPTEVRTAAGEAVAVGGPRVRALLTLLLLDAGQVVPTARLVDGLYGDNPPAGAANALQSQVSRLRQALPGVELEHSPTGYRLRVEPDDVDLHRFDRLVARGRAALADGDLATAADLLAAALRLWRGPALDSLPAPGALARRWEELRLTATEDRMEAALGLGEHQELVAELRELVAANPLRERLAAQLIRALHAAGRRAEALAVFAETRTVLAEELGTDPSAELAAVHLAVLRAEPAPTGRSTPLPAQLTSFVGRDDELERLAGRLAASRLVTLTGPGGTGKTRLAVEAVRSAGSPVCYIELAPLSDPAEVAPAVLGALGLRDAPQRTGEPPADPTDRLLTALRDRELLLVLDNCEHLIDAAAELAERLLAGCPGIRLLTTSREPLNIPGETVSPVPTLAVPPADVPFDTALRYPAVRLFLDRAAAARADLVLGPADLEPVLRICQALDGLPLAVELAAARVRSLSVADIAARLGDRFALLSRGTRTAQARHRTLRAVVEWSWELLAPAEQALAGALTVFAGGATLTAVQEVCAAFVDDVPDALAGLIEKSLLELGTGDRYRMLETVHAYCAERLTESGRAGLARRAHAEYFLALAERAGPHLRTGAQLGWLDRLDAEVDNLHSALHWATRSAPELALRLVSALTPYWWMRGKRYEGALLSARLAHAVGPVPPEGLEEEHAVCVLCAHSGLAETADLAEHLAVVQAGSPSWPPPRQPFLLMLWGMVAGPPPATGPPEHWPGIPDLLTAEPWSRGLSAFGTGLSALYQGKLVEAEDHLRHAVERFREVGERWGLSQAVAHLGQLTSWRGEHAEGIGLLSEGVRLSEELGAVESTADLLCERGKCLVLAGDVEAAAADFDRAAELATETGEPNTLASALAGLSTVAYRRGDLAGARERCLRALDVCRQSDTFTLAEMRVELLVQLGRITLAEGDAATAAGLLRQALDAAVARENARTAADALEALAAAAAPSDASRAAHLLGAAAGVRGTTVAGDPDVAATREAAVGQIGLAAYEVAFRAGRELTITGVELPALGA